MKYVLLCVVQVAVFASLLVPAQGCPTGKGVCVERKYCLESRLQEYLFHKCRTESKKQGVCCDASRTTLGKDCLLKKFAGKCVAESDCRPRTNAWGVQQSVWNTSSNVCYVERAQNHYCCPKDLLEKPDAVNPNKTNDVLQQNEVSNAYSEKNAFPTCQTPNKQDGHCVPFRMCDSFYDLYRKDVHKKNRKFVTLLIQYKCPVNTVVNSTSICCPNPVNSSSLILHEKVTKLDLQNCGPFPVGRKVLLGKNAGLGQYPWMASLMYKHNSTHLEPKCGGSLIHPRYVLTAAHCKQRPRGLIPMAVRLGEYDLSKKIDCEEDECAGPYRQYGIEKWILPKKYKRGKRDHDIALARLKTEVVLVAGQIEPICLPLTASLLMLKPKRLTVTGWGQTTENERNSDVLQKADLVPVESEDCRAESTLCARGVELEGHCQGDSGGPLTAIMPFEKSYITVLFGVVSGGGRCTVEDSTPGISVLVGYHINWILDNMDI